MTDLGGSVDVLRYRLDSTSVYERDATPLTFEQRGVQFTLADELLIARLDVPAKSIQEARTRVERVIRNWQLQAEITGSHYGFRFAYQGAKVRGSVADATSHREEAFQYEKDDNGPLIISYTQYPPPPEIDPGPELESAIRRLGRAITLGEFGEPIQSAAYFILTIAETRAGGRSAASKLFHIHREALDRVGMLASTRGSFSTARKASTSPMDLSRADAAWLGRAARTLPLHVCLVEAGKTPEFVTSVR